MEINQVLEKHKLSRIQPETLVSFEEIVLDAGLNDGIFFDLKKEQHKKMLFRQADNLPEEELVLYYEGENQDIMGGRHLYPYFEERGYEVIPNAHPSLLIKAMHYLTETKLAELGFSSFVKIILPTDLNHAFHCLSGYRCFLMVSCIMGKRELDFFTADEYFDKECVLLLRKKR